jgi:hypothetical protein
MTDWGDAPPTFDRASDAWGSSGGAFGDDGEGGGEQYIELIGSSLWVAGMADLGRFRSISDMVNIIQGFMVIKDAVILTRGGEVTPLTLPELRLLADDVAVVAQLGDDQGGAPGDGGGFGVEKHQQRLEVVTRDHIVDGDVLIQVDRSVMDFIDASDPKFIPMSDVRVRWASDGSLAARYPFALLQRTQILGFATVASVDGGADRTRRSLATLRGPSRSGADKPSASTSISAATGRDEVRPDTAWPIEDAATSTREAG